MFSFPLHVLLISSPELHQSVRLELASSSAQIAWKPGRHSVSRRDKPDAILVETEDLSEIAWLKSILPGAPVIVVQRKVDYQWGLAAIREGASEYLTVNELQGGNLFRVLRFWVERWKVERALDHSDSQLIAVQRMEALGRTVAGVAHDFRHFLQVVYGNCNLIKRLNENPAIDDMVDEVKLAAEKANALIKQMLDFAQGAPATRATLDINASLRQLEPLYAKLLSAGVQVECHLADEPLLAMLDHRFEQVIMNLVANAGDAIGQNKGTILLETRPLLLERDYLDTSLVLEAGAYIVLAVSDTGSGIDARDLDKIFDPFFTTKGRDVGTGLGLSVVFSFVQEWRGHITVASIPGQGTTFGLIFPRQGVEATSLTPRALPAGQGGTFVLREPNDALQLVLRRDLTALGWETRLLDSEGPTLAWDGGEETGAAIQVCRLSPRLLSHLGLLAPGVIGLATPFSRSEVALAVAGFLLPNG